MSLLETRGLSKHFGGVHAVAGLDLTLAEGEVLGLIGPNGAGKTTAFNLLSGFLAPAAGARSWASSRTRSASSGWRARSRSCAHSRD